MLEALALASAHRLSLVAHPGSEDRLQALVDEEDPQADHVSRVYDFNAYVLTFYSWLSSRWWTSRLRRAPRIRWWTAWLPGPRCPSRLWWTLIVEDAYDSQFTAANHLTVHQSKPWKE